MSTSLEKIRALSQEGQQERLDQQAVTALRPIHKENCVIYSVVYVVLDFA